MLEEGIIYRFPFSLPGREVVIMRYSPKLWVELFPDYHLCQVRYLWIRAIDWYE
jgi:hypothetical protein